MSDARAVNSMAAARPEYLTVDEVANWLRLSSKSVYRLAKNEPTMPVTVIGGSLRFRADHLERWLRAREQGRPGLSTPRRSNGRAAR
jgi:excisionase family DNA binding protein